MNIKTLYEQDFYPGYKMMPSYKKYKFVEAFIARLSTKDLLKLPALKKLD